MHDWKGVAETPAEHLQPYFAVNVHGPHLILTRALLPLLQRSDAGRVIFISSQWGQLPDGHSYGYMVSKAAQLGLMKSACLGARFPAGDSGRTLSAPGAVLTRMVPDEVYEAELAAVPLGRIANPAHVSATVAFLASDSAAYITGQTLAVDGGSHSSPPRNTSPKEQPMTLTAPHVTKRELAETTMRRSWFPVAGIPTSTPRNARRCSARNS